MALLTPQNISRAGLTPAFVAAASSDTFPNPSDRRTYLEVINAGGSPDVVAVAPVQAQIDTNIAGIIDVDAISVSVPASTGRKKIGPFPPAYTFNGIVTVTHTFITSVTVGVFVLPNT